MKEQEAIEYIESLAGCGIVPGLDSIKTLCDRLGNPQKELKFIHVAGTNGKGSVCSFIASALQEGGYKVGRYISPTIFEYRERIQVNAKYITQKALGELMEQVKDACDEMVKEGLPQPTPFEVETALAFLYFVQKKCDLVVLETGMGGLEDATNLIENTLVSVICSVSMDHMKFLGNTLGAIARQKAGIIKEGCLTVSAQQEDEAMQVIREVAVSKHSNLKVTYKDKISSVKYGLDKQRFSYGEYKNIEITLAGKYQIENAALALEALDALKTIGYSVKEDQLRKGFLNTVWLGRFSVIGKKPYFVVDGAHNEDAAKRLAESIEFYFTNKRIIYIMGILKDKEYEKIIALTHAYADQIITVTTPDNPRALPAYDLACEIAKVHQNVTAVDSLEEAVEVSYLLAGKDDCILAFGSLSFLGRLMKQVEKVNAKAGKKR